MIFSFHFARRMGKMELAEMTARWNHETGKLPWGVQKAFKDALTLVKEGKTQIVYGADYSGGSPCLVNATANMLGALGGEGGHGKPMAIYGDAISLYDQINRKLYAAGLNTQTHIVSPEAAHYLLHHFGEEQKVDDVVPNQYENQISDGELAKQWFDALAQECTTTDEDGFRPGEIMDDAIAGLKAAGFEQLD